MVDLLVNPVPSNDGLIATLLGPVRGPTMGSIAGEATIEVGSSEFTSERGVRDVAGGR